MFALRVQDRISIRLLEPHKDVEHFQLSVMGASASQRAVRMIFAYRTITKALFASKLTAPSVSLNTPAGSEGMCTGIWDAIDGPPVPRPGWVSMNGNGC